MAFKFNNKIPKKILFNGNEISKLKYLGNIVWELIKKTFAIVEIKGNQKQETTSGKNSIPYPYKTTTKTQGGITFTDNGDGSITLNGTSTGVAFTLATNINIEANNAYTLSLNANSKLSSNDYSVKFQDTSTSSRFNVLGASLSFSNANGYITHTPTQNSTSNDMYIWIGNGITLNNFVIKPQLEQNSTATSYEPYTGNQPSPNPDYPQDIEVVDGCNKFDGILELGTLDGSGLPILSTNQIRSKNYISVESNEIYDISGLPHATTNFYNSSFQLIGSATELNFTIPVGAKYIKFRTWTSDNIIDVNTKVMLTKGTQQKQYIPYGCVGIKRNGKNRFNINEDNHTTNSKVNVINDEMTLTGTTPEGVQYVDYIVPCKPNTTYTFSRKVEILSGSSTSRYVGVIYMRPNNKYLTNILMGQATKTFTTLEDTNFVNFRFFTQDEGTMTGTLTVKFSEILLEEGTVATEYQPYQEEITSLDLKGNKVLSDDEINIDEKGNVKLIKRWNSIVLDGSENWDVTIENDIRRYFVKGLGVKPKTKTISNFFIGSTSGTKFFQYGYVENPGSGNLSFCLGNNDTLATFKQWLSQNKPIVYYELAEPQIIDLGTIEPIEIFDGSTFELMANLDTDFTIEPYNND